MIHWIQIYHRVKLNFKKKENNFIDIKDTINDQKGNYLHPANNNFNHILFQNNKNLNLKKKTDYPVIVQNSNVFYNFGLNIYPNNNLLNDKPNMQHNIKRIFENSNILSRIDPSNSFLIIFFILIIRNEELHFFIFFVKLNK